MTNKYQIKSVVFDKISESINLYYELAPSPLGHAFQPIRLKKILV